MFRTLQWKLVFIFMLLVTAVMLIVATFMIINVTNYFQNDFAVQIDTALSGEVANQLNSAAGQEDAIKNMSDILLLYSGQLGISSSRNYYILDMQTGDVLATSSASNAPIEKTPNILSAMVGQTGNTLRNNAPYMDYAMSISPYIIYFKDSKTVITRVNAALLSIIMQALLFCAVFSLIIGHFLSKAFTGPITILTNNVRRLAKGELNVRTEVKSRDEIGDLTKTFNYMGSMMRSSIEMVSEEKNKIEIILQNLTNGVIAFDAEQNIIHMNNTAVSMLNIQDNTLLFDEFFSRFNLNISMAEFLYLERSMPLTREINVGSLIILAHFIPFKIKKQSEEETVKRQSEAALKLIGGVIVVLHDVTQQLALEESRREFVANVSHELRTPLTTIKTYAETLRSLVIEDPESSVRFIEIIENEADRMTRIVKDLLTLSSLDNKTEEKTVFPLDELLKSIAFKFEIELEKMNRKLVYIQSTGIPNIYADRDKIEQVIINILSNSMKYTEEDNTIEIMAGHLYNEVYIKIKDNGIGIPSKDLPFIFDRFYRVDKARTRQMGGTGLGLAIAKEIVENHGGSIKIESQYGSYTEVVITLPVFTEKKQN